jgi:hypothetical protein
MSKKVVSLSLLGAGAVTVLLGLALGLDGQRLMALPSATSAPAPTAQTHSAKPSAAKSKVTRPALPKDVIVTSHVDAKTHNLIAAFDLVDAGSRGERRALKPVLVPCKYATLTIWPRCYPGDHDSPRDHIFIFYDNVAKACYQTRNFESFLKVLAAQPKNITIYSEEYYFCADMWQPPDACYARLDEVLKAGNRRLVRTISGSLCDGLWPEWADGDYEPEVVYPGDKRITALVGKRSEWPSSLQN